MTQLMTTDQMLKQVQTAERNLAQHRVKSGGVPFLKLDKGTGEWVYGANADPVEDNDLWAIDPRSLQIGYVAWTDKPRKNVAEIMRSIFEPPLGNTDFPDVPNGAAWNEQRSMLLVGAKGANKGQTVRYSNGSMGGMERFDELVGEVLARAKTGKADLMPIVRLGSDHYRHAEYGRIHKPIFEIVEWASLDDSYEDIEDVEPEPEPEPEEVNPRQRRRRRRSAA